MGALQTFHWGALYPGMMDLIAPFCGSAKCSRHNFVFLEGVKAALTADAAWKEGWYTAKPQRGLRAAARVYAGWGFSQAVYRQKLDIEALGYSSLEDFLYNGDFKVALSAIKARAYVMPGQTDLYFPPEDSEFEVAHMPNANLVPVPSIWGHFAGGPGTNPNDVEFIDAKLKELLAS